MSGPAKNTRGAVAPSAAEPLDHRSHEPERAPRVADTRDAVVQEEPRHRLGEALVVRKMDVEVPETGDEVLTGPVHDLCRAGLFTRGLHRGDAPVVHDHGPGLSDPVVRVDHRDVLDRQVGLRCARRARRQGEQGCECEMESGQSHRRGPGEGLGCSNLRGDRGPCERGC
jgi:hypothetical protein